MPRGFTIYENLHIDALALLIGRQAEGRLDMRSWSMQALLYSQTTICKFHYVGGPGWIQICNCMQELLYMKTAM